MKVETNDKLAQQGLEVVNGDKIPQQACLDTLYLRAVIGTNNKTGIMWGEQVLRSLNDSDKRGIAQDAPKRCVKWKECRPERHVPPLTTSQEVGVVGELVYDAVTAGLGNRIREPLTPRPEKPIRLVLRGTMDLVCSQRGYATGTMVPPTLKAVQGRDRLPPFLPRGCREKQSDVEASSSRSGSGAQGG
jgi:hypothetical protein